MVCEISHGRIVFVPIEKDWSSKALKMRFKHLQRPIKMYITTIRGTSALMMHEITKWWIRNLNQKQELSSQKHELEQAIKAINAMESNSPKQKISVPAKIWKKQLKL